VAEHLASHHPVPLMRVGVHDVFCRSGDPADLFAMYGMGVQDIVHAAHQALARKQGR
jgi:transketolase